jgi:hypothetical protein
MNDRTLRIVASSGLVFGGIVGTAGTFAPSASLRGLAWGLDGVALIVASALLAIHFIRRGHDLAAAGFLVFMAGESLILSGTAMEPATSVPSFGAGSALWAAALAIISSAGVFPAIVKGLGFIASVLFAAVALQIFAGLPLSPLSTPLPFYAYPLLVATLLGWAWTHIRADS